MDLDGLLDLADRTRPQVHRFTVRTTYWPAVREQMDREGVPYLAVGTVASSTRRGGAVREHVVFAGEQPREVASVPMQWSTARAQVLHLLDSPRMVGYQVSPLWAGYHIPTRV